MTDETASPQQPPPVAPRWQPLGAIDRRMLGVLAEKAKTTPDGYPMSVSAICSGCNQKSNRFPLMQLGPEDVEESLERLRQMGAVAMIEGYGRVTKYRHYLYEWLGVEKVELSVMTELLLRGAQTEGELRGRVSRMDPIPDLPALRTLLASLKAKGLVIPLTPEGRGHVVTHALYAPRELEHLKTEYARGPAAVQCVEDIAAERTALPPVAHVARSPSVASSPVSTAPAEADSLRRQLDELRGQVAHLRSEMQDLALAQERIREELRGLKDALGS